MNNNDTEITNIMRYNINSDDAGPKLCKQYYLVDKKVVEFANAYERLNADDAIRIFLLGARHEDIDLCKTLAEKNTQLDHQIALRFADIYFPMNNSRYFTELRPLLKPAQIKSKKKK